MLRNTWLMALIVGVGGCGSDSDDGKNEAESKCQAFASTWCNQAISCSVQVGRVQASQQSAENDACVRVAVAAVPCDKAVGVDPAYDTCVANVKAMPCSTWDVAPTDLDTIRPPSSCVGVIKLQN